MRLAHMSHIKVHDDEVEDLISKIEDVIAYASRVSEIAKDAHLPSNRRINVTREDVVIRTDAEPILEQAPDREEDYFVVPRIIETND